MASRLAPSARMVTAHRTPVQLTFMRCFLPESGTERTYQPASGLEWPLSAADQSVIFEVGRLRPVFIRKRTSSGPGLKVPIADMETSMMLDELTGRSIFRSGYRPLVTWQPQEEYRPPQYLRVPCLAAQR